MKACNLNCIYWRSVLGNKAMTHQPTQQQQVELKFKQSLLLFLIKNLFNFASASPELAQV